MSEREMRDLEAKRGMAAALSVAASLVYDEPSQEAFADWTEGRLFEGAPFETDDPALLKGLALMDAWCQLAAENPDEALSSLKREHLRLFLGVGTPLVPSWATFYSDTNHQLFGQETLQVRGAYRDFGLRIEHERNEPDDHLGLMMRFLGYLMGLECEALERGDEAGAGRFRAAQEDFLVAHVLPWISVWAYAGRKEASSDFYRGVVEFVFGLIREYASIFGIAYCEEPPSFVRRTA